MGIEGNVNVSETAMGGQPVLTKEERKRAKELNASMTPISRGKRGQLGILSYQPERRVFQIEGGRFAKVYSVKGVELTGARRETLVRSLLGVSGGRIMRLSTFRYPGGSASVVFLTVYFDGQDYASVADEIESFDSDLGSMAGSIFRVSFSPCEMRDAMTFVYMNYHSMVRKLPEDGQKGRGGLRKFMTEELVPSGGGWFRVPKSDIVGRSFVCTEYCGKARKPLRDLAGIEGTLLTFVEFRELGEGCVGYYERMIRETYCSDSEFSGDALSNVSFCATVLCGDGRAARAASSALCDFFAGNGMVCPPCAGAERLALDSASSFGLSEYHCFRNADLGIVPKLFG